MKTSRELTQEIEELEAQRNATTIAETAQAERQVEANKKAEDAARKAEDRAVQQRIALAERKRREDTERDLAWPATVRETCFVEAINPLFKSWGLCQSFLDEQRQGGFCDQCKRGYQNAYWLQGLVHQEKTKEPAIFIATEFS